MAKLRYNADSVVESAVDVAFADKSRKGKYLSYLTCNGNRTEWSPIWSVIMSDNKIGRPRSGRHRPIYLSRA